MAKIDKKGNEKKNAFNIRNNKNKQYNVQFRFSLITQMEKDEKIGKNKWDIAR